MHSTKPIFLRPRFKLELSEKNQTILQNFEATKTTQSKFIANRLVDHVFIKFPKKRPRFCSLQLHLKIHKNLYL